jgi:RHS repeat-associated protein
MRAAAWWRGSGIIRTARCPPGAPEALPWAFSGQRSDASTGLYFYNARYYAPLSGRFVSADSIIPGIANPQAWNRYSYVLNNPLIYTDPSGHCPRPPSELGNVICVAGFIPTATSQVPDAVRLGLGLAGLSSAEFSFIGDNRDFSYDSPRDKSRFWVWISVDTGKIIESEFHPTCRTDGHCSGPRPTTENCWLPLNCLRSQKNDDGSIVLEYGAICDDPRSAQLACPLTTDGTITFSPNDEGSYDIKIDADAFPNLEGYLWSSGKLERQLFRIQNFSDVERSSGRANWQTAAMMAAPRDISQQFRLQPTRTSQNRWR